MKLYIRNYNEPKTHTPGDQSGAYETPDAEDVKQETKELNDLGPVGDEY